MLNSMPENCRRSIPFVAYQNLYVTSHMSFKIRNRRKRHFKLNVNWPPRAREGGGLPCHPMDVYSV